MYYKFKDLIVGNQYQFANNTFGYAKDSKSTSCQYCRFLNILNYWFKLKLKDSKKFLKNEYEVQVTAECITCYGHRIFIYLIEKNSSQYVAKDNFVKRVVI
jgi:hypothetical protein